MTGPTGNRCCDLRAQTRAIRKQPPGPVLRAYLCEPDDHLHLGDLDRATELGITTKDSA